MLVRTHAPRGIFSGSSLVVMMAVLAFASLGLARPAMADPKACIRAHSTGQREVKAGHLRVASQLFTSCGADDACPDALRKECAEFLESVKRTLPTVVFSVQDENESDVSNVKVYSGDDLLVDGLDGRAFEVDPGKYHLRFVLPSGDTLATDVVVREGEKQRLVQVKQKRAAAPVEVATASAPAPSVESHPSAGRKVATWVVGGVAVASLGTGVALAALGSGKKSDLDQCKPTCGAGMQGTYDSARSLFLGADIGFGAAIVAGAATAWLILTAPTHDEPAAPAQAAASPSHPRVSFGASPQPGGGGSVIVLGSF